MWCGCPSAAAQQGAGKGLAVQCEGDRHAARTVRQKSWKWGSQSSMCVPLMPFTAAASPASARKNTCGHMSRLSRANRRRLPKHCDCFLQFETCPCTQMKG